MIKANQGMMALNLTANFIYLNIEICPLDTTISFGTMFYR
jgi:hypothetical protein